MPQPSLPHPVLRPHLFGTLEHAFRWAYEGAPSLKGRGLTGSPEPSVWQVLRGEVTIRNANGEVHARAGDFVVPTTLARYQEFSRDAKIFSCGFRARWLDANHVFRLEKSLAFPVKAEPGLEGGIRELRAFSKRHLKGLWNNYSFLRIPFSVHVQAEYLFWRLLHDFTLAVEKRGVQPDVPHWEDDRLSVALNAIEFHPSDERFNTRKVAKQAGLSVSQLNRLFKQELGTSPYHQFDLRRFMKVVELVKKHRHSLKRISLENGFKNFSHFSAWFRSHAGMSPNAYRKRGLDD